MENDWIHDPSDTSFEGVLLAIGFCEFSAGCTYYDCINHRVRRFLDYRAVNLEKAGALCFKTDLLGGYQEKEVDDMEKEEKVFCKKDDREIDFARCCFNRTEEGQITRCFFVHNCDWAYRCVDCGKEDNVRFTKYCGGAHCKNGGANMREKFSNEELFVLAVLKKHGDCVQKDVTVLLLKRFGVKDLQTAAAMTSIAMKKLESKRLIKKEKISHCRKRVTFIGSWEKVCLSSHDLSFLENPPGDEEFADQLAWRNSSQRKESTRADTLPPDIRYPFSDNQFLDEEAVPVSSPPPSGPKNSSEHLSLDDLRREEWKLFQRFVGGIQIPTEVEARVLKIWADYMHELSQLSD